MILPDANVLIYALDTTSVHHERARRWLEQTLSGREAVGFAWVVLLAVLRLTTKASVFSSPLTATEALEVIDEWLAQAPSVVVQPTSRHVAVLRTLLEATGTAGNLTSDAHLAALALEHGAVIASADRDFERFPGVRRSDPLTA